MAKREDPPFQFQLASTCLTACYFIGLRPQLDPEIRDPAALRAQVPEDVPDYPLRPEAREHLAQRVEQIWHQNNRLWLLDVPGRARLHLYLVEILPCARNHARHHLRLRYRHVVLRLHHGRALYWLSNFPWR